MAEVDPPVVVIDPSVTDPPVTDPPNGDADKPVTREEFNKIFARMQAADKRASEAEKARDANKKALDEIETAKLGDVEKAKKEADDARKLAESTAAELKSTRLETAFVKTSGVAWHDADTAYAILTSQYMDGVDIDSNGKVTGMAEAVNRLAKEKPFLVNTGVIVPNGQPTGSSHNGRKGDSAEQEKARAAELARRMPAGFRKH